MTVYAGSEDVNHRYERIVIGISWSTSNLTLGIDLTGKLIEEGEIYHTGEGASFSFPALNKLTSAEIDVTAFDRDKRTISGTFTVKGEGVQNFSTYPYAASGSFDDVEF